MKKSGYRSSFHIYFIFFSSLLGTSLAAILMLLALVTVQKPNGEPAKSNWPKYFTETISNEILFTDGKPRLTQSGLKTLQEHKIGIQILDNTGNEIYAFQKPAHGRSSYSNMELLRLSQNKGLDHAETTTFVGGVADKESEYAYILYFPMKIKTITMYLNGERFTGGKAVIFSITFILLLTIVIAGILYGLWTVRVINRITSSIENISKRCYLPLKNQGAYGDLYHSLNALDREIRAGDQLRKETEALQKQWIANITHDLKTPLSPIKGYAELLLADSELAEKNRKEYAGIMLKNAVYMEGLIDDLKLTYQIETNMLPVKRQEQNIVRYLRELVIDILNRPEYESRHIQFDTTEEIIPFSFDGRLLTRALQNLIINAFVHGDETTEISIQLSVSGHQLTIIIADNGKGMTDIEAGRLFQRYYRGTSTEHKPEGTGLGLAIAKSIVELHHGTISVLSVPASGTTFILVFPLT